MITISELYQLLFGKNHLDDGTVIDMAEHGRIGGVSTGQGFKAVRILDNAGDPINSFGGGTEYTDGGTPPTNPVGNTIIWDSAGTWKNVSNTDPLPVTASISTAGLATETKQDTIIGHLDGVEGILTTIDADTGNLPTIETNTDSLTVVGGGLEATALRVTLASDSTGVLSVDDNGGSLTVDGTFWQATQPVSFTNSTDVATQTTLAAINTKLVSGTDIGDVTINNASGASAVNIQDGGNSITVDGTVAVSGTVTVDLGANNDVTVTSGTITANLGATDNAVLDQIELNQDSQTAILTTIDADTGGILTAVQLIDNAISGNEMQVDVVTMPTVTVTATDLDVRNLVSATDSVTTVETTYATSTLSNVAGSASSVQLLASTAGRKGGYFYNDSSAICYLKLGTTASTTSFTIAMEANSFYELPQPCYTGRIDAIWSSATGDIRITEIIA